MSKLSYDGLKTFKEKNDETYMGKEDVLSALDLEEETSVNDDDIIIKGQPETGDLVRIKASDFFSKVEDEIGDINSALAELPQIQTGQFRTDENAIAADATSTVATITFPTAFKSTPQLFFGISSVSSVNYGYVAVSAVDVSTAGFTVQVHNRSTSASLQPIINWLAIA